MSISGIVNTALSSLLTATQSAQSGQGKFQQVQSEFQQLGQDLQTGNLAQAQQDYATLSQNFSGAQTGTTAATTTAASTANNSNPIAQAFAALSQDLQNGNISAAQTDYATIQQDFQQQQGSSQVHHHHHGGGGGGQKGSQVSQALSSLSTALQAGNLTNAQTAFATLQQDLQQFTAGGSSGSTTGSSTSSSPSQANGSNLNVTA
jgi:outer membrane protein assembly factor BamD (BamD/ComL family)